MQVITHNPVLSTPTIKTSASGQAKPTEVWTPEEAKKQLAENGYVVIPDVLTPEEVETAKKLHDEWRVSIPNHDRTHTAVDPHGIYKFHEAGHQRHAWFIRTNPRVQSYFKALWQTEDLISSFDGSCYISKNLGKKDNVWTHTDQSPRRTMSTAALTKTW